MERNSTKTAFRYWVTEVDRSYSESGGSVLMFGYPFNDDLEELEWPSPARRLLAINATSRAINSLRLSGAHVAGRGPVVGVRGWTTPMEPPFLLTDQLDAVVIADCEVQLEMSEVGREVVNREYRPEQFPVETSEWFGLLFPEDEERAHLMAFSTNQQARIKNGDQLIFTEWEKPCGVLMT